MKSNDLTLKEITALLETRALSTHELTQAYLARIDSLNPQYRAVIATNPVALEQAAQMDKERAQGNLHGPLHGVPILIKDNIDSGDQMCTTAGSLALQDSQALKPAFLVEKLQQAGALILGKTNLSEWANMRSTRSSTGWSSVGGQTCNAFDPTRSPGGSSSGSGVSVSLGMCAAAVGTETDGSVVIPASMNSLVGFKPTVGRISRTGVIPISHTQDTAGPMARTVEDAALLLVSMLGSDTEDPASFDSQKLAVALSFLDHNSLRGARVGVARSHCGHHEAVDAIVEDAILALTDCGATIVDEVGLATSEDFDACEEIVLLYELKAGLNAYLARLGPNASIRTLKDLIEFNEQNAEKTMPYFGQEHFHLAQSTDSLNEPAYIDALATCQLLARRHGIDAALAEHRLDVLLAPTIGPAWSIDLVNGDHRSSCCATPAAVSGYPHVTVPGGFVHGLPVGISLFAGHMRDAKVLSYGYAFEQQTQHHRAPVLD